MVVHHADHEMQLHVRRGQAGLRLEKSSRLREIGGDHAAPLAAVAADFLRQAQPAAEGGAEQVQAARPEGKNVIHVIAQVAPDARQVVRDSDAVLPQLFAVADAGEHEQLRRLQSPQGDDDLRFRLHGLNLRIQRKFDPCGTAIFQDHAPRPRPGDHLQVRPPQMRLQVGARRAPALAVFLRHLVGAHALLLRAVEVVVARKSRLLRGVDENPLERVAGAQAGDMQRPAAAVIFAVQRFVVLRALEVRQHLGVGPARVAERRPAVVVDRWPRM